jgi:hypothetical protein
LVTVSWHYIDVAAATILQVRQRFGEGRGLCRVVEQQRAVGDDALAAGELRQTRQ